ncbi:MAG: cytochrome P450 [Solirubrobacteraceae bacterium]
MSRDSEYPLGAAIALDDLSGNPHAALARLRVGEPVSWVPCLEGWLVTRHDLAVAVMRDPVSFTVDDPRFSTARVLGPSMLSLDGEEHIRHRGPFVAPFRTGPVARALSGVVTQRVTQLIDGLQPRGQMELRREFAGPLSAAVMAEALGLGPDEVDDLLGWYGTIVASVTAITGGQSPTAEGAQASAALRDRLESAILAGSGRGVLAAAHAEGHGTLRPQEIAANGAVLLFGGIETTEGMIANATLELLRRPEQMERVRGDLRVVDAMIDESLRLEPAAAVVDRYAVSDCALGSAQVRQGELVRISITAANRDPAVFADPDRFDPARPNLRRHLAFAQGPHVCLGVQLARLEAHAALRSLVERLPRLRLDARRPAEVRGLVFRKPPRLDVLWDR